MRTSSARVTAVPPTVFSEMSALALRTGAVNLGQGFPDTDGPEGMLRVAREAIANGVNQYSPGLGEPALRQAIVDHKRTRYQLEYDPDTEVLVTVGATEALLVRARVAFRARYETAIVERGAER